MKISNKIKDDQIETRTQFMMNIEKKFLEKETSLLWFDCESGEEDFYAGTIATALRSKRGADTRGQVAALNDDDCIE